MSVQRTFTLIPPTTTARGESPERAQHVRPMTSKQVRKAYKAAGRGPPISRAERIKQEKAEQERIRKEFEKEKAAAKARAAREKKREKEDLEREQKRKQGMPLVKVRPSQDTIARFVRGNGSGKKRNAAGQPLKEDTEDSDSPTALEEQPEGQREEQTNEQGDEQPEEAPEEAPEEPAYISLPTIDEDRRPEEKELDLIPEDDESDLEQLLDTFEERPPPAEIQREPNAEIGTDEFGDMLDDTELDPSAAEISKLARGADSEADERDETIFMKPATPSIQTEKTRRPRPPLLSSSPRQLPPLSTQAILGNFDDYFPTSSQQTRELEEEISHSTAHPILKPMAKPSQPPKPKVDAEAQARPLSPQPPPPPPPPPPPRFFTSSGTQEVVAMVLHRSRRTAALEEIHEQERVQAQMDEVKQRNRQQTRARAPRQQSPNVSRPIAPEKTESMTKSVAPLGLDKENAIPSIVSSYGLSSFGLTASQETEYGGDWIDDEGLDIIL